MNLNYLSKSPLEIYGIMEYANQAIAFLKEMLIIWDDSNNIVTDT